MGISFGSGLGAGLSLSWASSRTHRNAVRLGSIIRPPASRVCKHDYSSTSCPLVDEENRSTFTTSGAALLCIVSQTPRENVMTRQLGLGQVALAVIVFTAPTSRAD